MSYTLFYLMALPVGFIASELWLNSRKDITATYRWVVRGGWLAVVLYFLSDTGLSL